jgi:hypothetical protein
MRRTFKRHVAGAQLAQALPEIVRVSGDVKDFQGMSFGGETCLLETLDGVLLV